MVRRFSIWLFQTLQHSELQGNAGQNGLFRLKGEDKFKRKIEKGEMMKC
jgi:hypothetical protein